MTEKDRKKLIEEIDKLHVGTATGIGINGTRVIYLIQKDDVINIIENFISEPTEGSTEDAKEPERCCQPNWEEMYKNLAVEHEELKLRHDHVAQKLDRAQASLRTFEFIFGRRLDGIC